MFSSVSVEESGINTRDKKAGQGQFERILRLAWHAGLLGAESDPPAVTESFGNRNDTIL